MIQKMYILIVMFPQFSRFVGQISDHVGQKMNFNMLSKALSGIGMAIGLVTPCAFGNLSGTLYTAGDGQPAGYRDPKSYGGEFTAVLSGNSSVSTYVLSHYASVATATVNKQIGFQTFCVEMTQEFSPGTTYNAAIGSTIQPGNTSLTQGVAWLYMEFATGQLASYNYGTSGTSREACADQLQDAIWYLQGEMTAGNSSYWNDKNNLLYSFNLSDPSADPFIKLVTQVFGSLGTAEKSTAASGASNFGVEVLNLAGTCNGTTVYAQDQLVYCPVPEPGTIAAGVLLLLPLGWSIARAKRAGKIQ